MRRRLLRPLLLAAALPLLSGCQQHNLLDAKGPVGAAEANILIIATIIMLAIIVPTMIATVIFALWYRETNPRARYRPDWAFSGRIELVVWSVPLLTITFLGAIAWIGAHQLDPATPLASDKKPLQVQVVSLD
jgi:cytochrome o ubiquinol oxidase subunit 2